MFVALCAGVTLHEYLAITARDLPAGDRWTVIAVGVAGFWGFHDLPTDWIVFEVVTLFLFAFTFVLLRPPDLAQAFPRAAAIFAGYLYLPLLLAFLVRLHALPDGRDWIYVAFLIAWSGDTCAYFAGRALGRHKLYPLISPGKTLEGALGGLAGSFLGVLGAKLTFFPDLTLWDSAALALVGGVLGQVGDLCESMLKRSYAVKDSGTIMPGHGGLLDRIDALLFILPYTFGYAVLVHPLVL
jgi:phosphatidate cytidylyltransferase